MMHIFSRFKAGLYYAAESTSMLWQHPIVLIYLLGLFLTNACIYILSYNLIGYQQGPDFHAPAGNLLAYLIPQTGGLVYLAYIFSIFLNILLHTLLSVALTEHVHALMHDRTPLLKEIYSATKEHWLNTFYLSILIAFVSACINIVSIHTAPFTSTFAHSPEGLLFYLSIIPGLLFFTWSAISFFVIPIIALTRLKITQAFSFSMHLLFKYIPEILGGLFLISLIFLFANMANSILNEYLMPSIFGFIQIYFSIFIHIFFATLLLIFKTCFFLEKTAKAPKTKEYIPDYTQF